MSESSTRWCLFVRPAAGPPEEFFELRQNGSYIWAARGKPFTMGATNGRTLASETDAHAGYDKLAADRQAEGFECIFEGEYLPGSFDFDLLQHTIEAGVRVDFEAIKAEYADETISGFSLFTDGGGMTLCTAAMADNSFDPDEPDFEYYLTNPAEWPYDFEASGLLLAYRMILGPSYLVFDQPFEKEVPDYVDRFFETCVRALEALDRDGLFGTGEARENFLLLFGDSDGGPTNAHFKRLNPPNVFRRYADNYPD